MKNKKILAGGTFNLIHLGHVLFLKKAKSLGNYLVVVIANDRTVLRNKKPLIFKAEERKKMIENIKGVDRVVIGEPLKNDRDYLNIIKSEKPDIVALGYDQTVNEKRLKKLLKDAGLSCIIVRLPKFGNYKTKNIIKKIKK